MVVFLLLLLIILQTGKEGKHILSYSNFATEFISELYEQGYTKREIKEQYDEYLNRCEEEGEPTIEIESYLRRIRKIFQDFEENKIFEQLDNVYNGDDDDLLLKAVQFKKNQQRAQDKARIEGKVFRETARLTNALEAYYMAMIEAIKEVPVPKITKTKVSKKGNWGVVNLADLHNNEEVYGENFQNNYNFIIAGQRLKLLADEAKTYFNAKGVKKVLIAGLGDFLNSDRRLDEKYYQATNRANATVLSAYLLEQFIIDLAEEYAITIAFVTGNESRIDKDNEMSKLSSTNNFDFMIYEYLRVLFRGQPVKFIDPLKVDRELFLDLDGFGLIMSHGEGIKTEKNIRDIFWRYTANGYKPDYLIYGHLHSTFITDYSARSGSLCGSNAYAEKQLNLHGRASQNIMIIDKYKTVTPIRIDLQNVEKVKGYDIIEKLESYNTKSQSKMTKKDVIVQVVKI